MIAYMCLAGVQFWLAALIPEWLWLWGSSRLNAALRRQAFQRIRHRSGSRPSSQVFPNSASMERFLCSPSSSPRGSLTAGAAGSSPRGSIERLIASGSLDKIAEKATQSLALSTATQEAAADSGTDGDTSTSPLIPATSI